VRAAELLTLDDPDPVRAAEADRAGDGVLGLRHLERLRHAARDQHQVENRSTEYPAGLAVGSHEPERA